MKPLDDMGTITPEEIVDVAKENARLFKEARIKTNQIRNFYAEINSMKLILQTQKGKESEESILVKMNRKLILLKPKLAYAAGRQQGVKKVYDFMSRAINGVGAAEDNKKLEAYQNFFDLIESVVAYHKYYGDN